MFDWEDLRHFSAFISAGSLSAAAKRLGVDHATVARRISSLEASLQLKLVDRRPRAYALTEQGVRVGEFAEQMLASSFALEHFASADQQAVEGEVVIAAPPALLGSMVARRLGELYKRYPALQLTLVGSKSRASLARREADVAITLARPTEPTLVASLLGHLEYSWTHRRPTCADANRTCTSATTTLRRNPHSSAGCLSRPQVALSPCTATTCASRPRLRPVAWG